MRTLVAGFAEQLRQAQAIGKQIPPIEHSVDLNAVWVLGLGGSAFGAEVVRNYVADQLRVPFLISRSYSVPAAVGPGSLVIASSYSGNTEETLEAVADAQRQGAQQIVCITSGGELARWADAHGYPVVRLPEGFPPRAASGLSIVVQLHLLHQSGLLTDVSNAIEHAIAAVEGFPQAQHVAAQALAQALRGQLAVIYSADAIDSVALRLRQQLNENAKRLCWHHTLPEMNHNELVGWEGPRVALDNCQAILLRSSYEHPRVALRFAILEELLGQRGVAGVHTVRVEAKTRLSELFMLIHFTDWVSVYLAEDEGVDPTPVQVIDYLKSELAQRP
ncbi:MAG: bifunctional phosphoglucose/phosphomannose isomerase [Bacteroidia bacterium]|nr:bifunctional phosphoglucose/phosphomannose isomerase [Bacteroidia bacterium]